MLHRRSAVALGSLRSSRRRGATGRLRSLALTESPVAARLRRDRVMSEGHFGNLANWSGGWTCRPARVQG